MTIPISLLLKTNAGQILGSMSHWLTKAADHAKAHEIDDSALMAARLYPDMFPMGRQVQVASDMAARGAARLAGLEPASTPDTEETLTQLSDRCTAALASITALDDAAIDADPDSIITFAAGRGEISMPKAQFLATFIIPNVIFHATTAYGLLRHQGVPLGKLDFLSGGSMPGQ
ncbi:MAG: DUF1993 domain-containing protein [Pseudomonadota bacterium]